MAILSDAQIYGDLTVTGNAVFAEKLMKDGTEYVNETNLIEAIAECNNAIETYKQEFNAALAAYVTIYSGNIEPSAITDPNFTPKNGDIYIQV